MQIVIPMAGKGERFRAAGYKVPKPLIKVDGVPMIAHVVDLFPGEDNFVFICSEEHLSRTPLRETLLALKSKAKVVSIDPHDRGPAWSILAAESLVLEEEPVMVNYCDFSMAWDYKNFLRTIREKNPDSASICYKGFHPHLLGTNLYAGVRADERGYALEVKEKHSFTPDKRDTWQQAGTFYFRSGAILKKYCRLACDSGINVNGEYYISHLFNFLIKDGLASLVYPVPYFCQWGTPEDLAEYKRWMRIARGGSAPDEAVPVGAHAEKSFAYWRAFLKEKQSLSA